MARALPTNTLHELADGVLVWLQPGGESGVSNAGVLRNISGSNTYAGVVTLGTNSRINSDAGLLTLNTGTITGSGFGLSVGGAGNTTISSIIGTGAGMFTKDGSGTVTLSGANTYTGDTVVNDGTVSLAGSLAGSTVKVMGGTFRGSGSIGGLASTSGTVRPGNSPGQFTSASAASLGAGATYTVEIDGATPVTGYSQLVVPGATLGGTLALVTSTPSFDPQIGTRFTIIDNTGSKRLAGTFKGLPEGGTIALGSQTYTITYKGGTGNNDVQLIRTRSIPTPTGPLITSPFNLDAGVIASSTAGLIQLTTATGIVRQFQPFRGYAGLISVNAVDRTGDGVSDALIVSKASPGNLSTVMMIDAATGRQAMFFNAFGTSFLGGARVSAGLADIGGIAGTLPSNRTICDGDSPTRSASSSMR